jgi:putative ABC transport system permease protein
MPTSLFMDSWAGMSVSGVLMFSGIALAILLIATFNYTNLSVARSIRRAKEVGIRKVTGATRAHIFAQFLSESVLSALLALLFAFFLTKILVLNAGFSRLVSGIEVDAVLLLWFLIFSICVGLMAGTLPALLFSKINSIQALKNLAGIKLLKVGTLRKSLIVIQFSVSLVFVIVLLVVYRQSDYVATADNGYNRENIISVALQGVDYALVSSKLAAHAQVEKATAASGNFGLGFGQPVELQKQQGEESARFAQYSVDGQFIPTMELTLLAGQNFPKDVSAENSPYIILNEKALQVLGLGTPAEAIGEALWLNDSLPVEVIGVVQDFHYLSLKHPIGPLVLQYHPDEFNILNLKVSDPNNASFRAYLQETWKELDPLHPVEYYVYEEQFYDKWIHAQDTTFMGSFAFMAIFIACMGLLGVVMFSMETRIKEIGIRKVIGASVGSLTLLLSKDFLKLILIAAVFALPLGYWIGNLFLQEYAYRIMLGIKLLSLGFGIVLLLGLMIVSSQTVKAALANPVDSLRNE